MDFNQFCYMAAGVAALTACTESGTLKLDGRIEQKSAALTQSGEGGLELASGALVIERARIAASEIEIEGGEDEEREAEMGPAIVDLALDGSPTTVTVNTVEAGSYHTLGFELSPHTIDGEPATILVQGTFEGEAFSFRSTWSPELEFGLDPKVVVPANGEATVGVTFDVGTWFLDEDGDPIAPSDPANHERIQKKLARAMTAQAVEVELEGDDDD